MDACSLTVPALPLLHSLYKNYIGDEGASALAAVLKETKISNLEYAATPKVLAFVSAPADRTAILSLSLSSVGGVTRSITKNSNPLSLVGG